MSSIKNFCMSLITKLEASALKSEQFGRDTMPKTHCINTAKEAAQAGKDFVAACKKHIEACKDCHGSCNAMIAAVEKAIEKNNACASACAGAGSDADCKEVCKESAQASRHAVQVCRQAVSNLC